jgi:alpha-beta hydrolase superfamily lysophospholipase
MKTLIDHAHRVCTALVGVAAVMVTMPNPLGPAAASPVQTKVHAFDGHRVTLDVYPAVGPLRGAAILSHGFTRSRRTLAGHAQALADAGVLVLTPDLPCTSTSAATPGPLLQWWARCVQAEPSAPR